MIIIVFGEPAPQGSKRHVGNGVMIESSKKVAPWRQDVVAAAKEAMEGFATFDGPLVVKMVFTLHKPASAPKKRRTWPDRKPDLDKLVRSTSDALVTAGAIRDDARIVEFTRLAKVFPGGDTDALSSPGVLIEIHPLVEHADLRQGQLAVA